MTAALFLLMALASRVSLVDKVFAIPASEWRYWDHPIGEQPALVDFQFQATGRDSRVRLVLVDRKELDAWLAGRAHDEISATPVGPTGFLRLVVNEPGTYVVIHNLGARPATVRMGVYLEQPQVRYLSPARRVAVILISFAVFFGIVSWSGVKLLRAIRR